MIQELIDQIVKDTPALPEGWEYKVTYKQSYDGATKTWSFTATSIPVEKKEESK